MAKWENCKRCGGENEIVQDKPIDNGIKRCLRCKECGLEDTEYLEFK